MTINNHLIEVLVFRQTTCKFSVDVFALMVFFSTSNIFYLTYTLAVELHVPLGSMAAKPVTSAGSFRFGAFMAQL